MSQITGAPSQAYDRVDVEMEVLSDFIRLHLTG